MCACTLLPCNLEFLEFLAYINYLMKGTGVLARNVITNSKNNFVTFIVETLFEVVTIIIFH